VQVQITLAGDVRVGETVVGGPPRVALAALVLERPAGLPRESLADIVWPDGAPKTWASALRTHISRVRSVLAAAVPGAGEIVVAGETGYQLSLPSSITLEVDTEAAERDLGAARAALAGGDGAAALAAAAAAVARLRPPFLPGHPGGWADAVRAGLDDLLVGAHEVASQAALAAGDPDRALAAADAAVARSPLRESAHRARLAALAAAGNRAEALRAYQRLRRALADELGVDPSPETEAAYVALLGPPAPGASPSRPTAPARPAAAPFVGREAELAVLAEAWDQAMGGARHVVVVTGEAGIGKSRLASEAARRVGQGGGLVLFGRCDEEAIVPYQPLVEALDGYVAATPPGELPALGDEARAELAAVLPSLDAPRRPPSGDGRARLFGAVTDLVSAAAKERPVLLVLDDLQWADDDTLLLMRHLVRHAGDAAVLVAAITRDHDLEPGHTLGDVVLSLDRDGWVRRLPLRGLAEPEVLELVARLGAPGDAGTYAATARRLVAETAGNPFLVTEVLRSGGEIPPGVQELVAARVARLDPASADLLRAAAIAGARFDLDVVAEAAGLAGRPLLDALDAALASGLVVEEDADRYRFPHDIVRRTVVAQLSAARRRALHHALAGAIEDRRGDAVEEHAAVLAHHSALGAGPRGDVRAVHWSRLASTQAAARSAPTEAVRLCRQALVRVPAGNDGLRAAVTADLGQALVATGDPAGPATLVEAADLARARGTVDVLGAAALALADAAEYAPDVAADARRLVDAAVTARPGPDPLCHARLLVRQIRLSPPGMPTVRPPTSTLDALAAHVAGLDDAAHLDERRALAAELATLAGASSDPGARIRAAHEQAMAAAYLADDEAVDEAMVTLESLCDSAFAAAMLAEHHATRLARSGRFAEAQATLDVVASAHADAGPEAARVAVERHRAVLAHLWAGGPTVAPPPPPASPGPPDSLNALHDLGLAALTGDPRARTWLAPHADLVCGLGYRTFAGAASFHLGRLAANEGEWAEAERNLLSALRLHTALRARPWVAWTQATLAAVLEARGRPSDREWIAGLRAEARWVAGDLGLRSLPLRGLLEP
jgi:DNA-binding SARP family transcriptional activator